MALNRHEDFLLARVFGHVKRNEAALGQPDVSDTYREPMQLYPGEVPADLMARLESPESPPTFVGAPDAPNATLREYGGSWRAQHDLNVRPPGPQPGALSN